MQTQNHAFYQQRDSCTSVLGSTNKVCFPKDVCMNYRPPSGGCILDASSPHKRRNCAHMWGTPLRSMGRLGIKARYPNELEEIGLLPTMLCRGFKPKASTNLFRMRFRPKARESSARGHCDFILHPWRSKVFVRPDMIFPNNMKKPKQMHP